MPKRKKSLSDVDWMYDDSDDKIEQEPLEQSLSEAYECRKMLCLKLHALRSDYESVLRQYRATSMYIDALSTARLSKPSVLRNIIFCKTVCESESQPATQVSE